MPMFSDHCKAVPIKSLPVRPVRMTEKKHTFKHIVVEYLSFRTLQVVLGRTLHSASLMFSCCICFCLTAADLFHCASEQLRSFTHIKKKKKKSTQPDPFEGGVVTYSRRIKRSAGRLLQMLSGHAAMTAKGKWRAVSQAVSGHMDPFTAWLMYGPDRRARADYLSSRGMWANLHKRLHSGVSRKENNHFREEWRFSVISSCWFATSLLQLSGMFRETVDFFCIYV